MIIVHATWDEVFKIRFRLVSKKNKYSEKMYNKAKNIVFYFEKRIKVIQNVWNVEGLCFRRDFWLHIRNPNSQDNIDAPTKIKLIFSI